MDYNKKLTKTGSISIPVALRREYGIAAGDRFTVDVNTKGEIVLRRTGEVCLFCKSDQQVKPYQGRQICRRCALNLLKEWEG